MSDQEFRPRKLEPERLHYPLWVQVLIVLIILGLLGAAIHLIAVEYDKYHTEQAPELGESGTGGIQFVTVVSSQPVENVLLSGIYVVPVIRGIGEIGPWGLEMEGVKRCMLITGIAGYRLMPWHFDKVMQCLNEDYQICRNGMIADIAFVEKTLRYVAELEVTTLLQQMRHLIDALLSNGYVVYPTNGSMITVCGRQVGG